MNSVAIYDIASGEWYLQPTGGQIPSPMAQGCTVVASASDGSSHNIYWYGGFNGLDLNSTFSDDVWILSVPSFMWMKVYTGNSTHGRAGHKCTKPYPDQMMVIGGYTPEVLTTPTCVEGGIVQVFNLTSTEWLNRYDPTVWSNYTVPSMIVSMIGGTGEGGATELAPTAWVNDSLSQLFATPYTKTIPQWYPYSNVTADNTNSTVVPIAHPSHGGGMASWVAPVLAVVVSLVAISAILVCVLLFRRRKYLRQQRASGVSDDELRRTRIMSWVRGMPTDTKAHTVSTESEIHSPLDQDTPEMEQVTFHEVPLNQVHEMMGKHCPAPAHDILVLRSPNP